MIKFQFKVIAEEQRQHTIKPDDKQHEGILVDLDIKANEAINSVQDFVYVEYIVDVRVTVIDPMGPISLTLPSSSYPSYIV